MQVFTPAQYDNLQRAVYDEIVEQECNTRTEYNLGWFHKWFDSDYRNIDGMIKFIWRSQMKLIESMMIDREKKINLPEIGTYFIKQGKLDIEYWLKERGYISRFDCPPEMRIQAITWAKAKKYNRRCFGIHTVRSYNIPEKYNEAAPLYHHKHMKFFTTKYLFMDENAIWNIAKIVWEADKGFVEMASLIEVPHWEEAEDWQRDKVCSDVAYLLEYENAPESALHDIWVDAMREHGWKHGEKIDKEQHTHPHLLPYNELPIEEKIRNNLMWTLVRKFIGYKRTYDRVAKDKPVDVGVPATPVEE